MHASDMFVSHASQTYVHMCVPPAATRELHALDLDNKRESSPPTVPTRGVAITVDKCLYTNVSGLLPYVQPVKNRKKRYRGTAVVETPPSLIPHHP